MVFLHLALKALIAEASTESQAANGASEAAVATSGSEKGALPDAARNTYLLVQDASFTFL